LKTTAFQKIREYIPITIREPLYSALNKHPYHDNFYQMNCIFVHIPKTAGTSIGEAIFGTGNTGHWKAKDYQWLNPQLFKKSFKFCIVRNPWERALSAYHYLKNGGNTTSDRYWKEENLGGINSFDEFIKEKLNQDSIYKWGHFIPQTDFILLEDESNQMDYVGRYENLDKDFKEICEKLDIKRELPHQNKSKKPKDYRSSYTENSKRIIEELYKDDITLLGYKF